MHILVLYTPNNFFWPAAADFWMLIFMPQLHPSSGNWFWWPASPRGTGNLHPLPGAFAAADIQRIRCALSYDYMYIAYLSIMTFAGSANPLGPHYVGTL